MTHPSPPVAAARRRAGRPTVALERGTILSVARRTFARDGLAGASLSRIAEELGIRTPSLLYHFPSKEALYEAAVIEMIDELDLLLARAVAPRSEPSEPFVDRLDRLSDALTDYFEAHPETAGLLLRELAAGRTDSPAAARAEQALRNAVTFVETQHPGAYGVEPDAARMPVHVTMSVLGAHMLWFAVLDVSRRLGGTACPPHTRRAAARAHARALCGLAG